MTEPLNGENGLRSVPALFRRNAKNNPSAPAYREKEFGIWQTWTWADALSEAEALALGLIDLGINRGDFVAIIGRNRPSLYISMIGIENGGRSSRSVVSGRSSRRDGLCYGPLRCAFRDRGGSGTG